MTLKVELTHIVESQSLTEFLQALLANQRFKDLRDADFQRHDHQVNSFCIGSTAFKESDTVFTGNGAYADMALVLLLLEEIANQPRQRPNLSKKIESEPTIVS